jgi:hypothetical protein
MEQTFNVTGIIIPRNWAVADCTNHPEVVKQVTKKTAIVIITEDKVKVFGKGRDEIIRKKCWPLSTPHSVAEGSIILQRECGVAIPIEKVETEADRILNGSGQKHVNSAKPVVV